MYLILSVDRAVQNGPPSSPLEEETRVLIFYYFLYTYYYLLLYIYLLLFIFIIQHFLRAVPGEVEWLLAPGARAQQAGWKKAIKPHQVLKVDRCRQILDR